MSIAWLPINQAGAESAASWTSVYAWITATARELFGDSSARSATRDSAFSETLKQTYFAHSPTCESRKHKFRDNGLHVENPPDDWTDESSWRKANPNWGVSVQPDVVAQLAAKAMQMPAAQANFKTKHLDVWVNADQAWMDMRAWDRCADESLTLEQFAGETCYVGLDLASKTDIAARVAIFPKQVDGQTHYYLFCRYFLPEQAVEDGRNSQYRGWVVQNLVTVTPGDVLDFQAVEDDVMALSSSHQVAEVDYDPWQATQLAQRLQANGATTVEFRNTVGNFSAPMKELDALARSGRLHHNGDPVLTWMVSNVVCHTDAKENIYPRKERPENKIDGVIAAITALGRAMVAQSTSSFWE